VIGTGPRCFGVHGADLDGDGRIDVVGAIENAGDVRWWRNDGGDPLGWTQYLIDGALPGADGLIPGDFDGDGRLDVAASSTSTASVVVWYRNEGGDPIQWTKGVIDPAFVGNYELAVADVNLDGRLDLLGGSWDGKLVAWFENLGGDPLAWTTHVVDGNFDGAHCVKAGDVDGDGDMDIAATGGFVNEVAWWRNDGGAPTVWTKQTVRTGFVGGRSVELADLDRDGDLDLVGACWTSEATWWRNDGGDPVVWTEQVIDGAVQGGHHVRVADVNGDGRQDVLVAAFAESDVLWFENGGGDPIQWTEHVVQGNYQSPIEVDAADLDGDGALEILSSSYSLAGNFRYWDATDFVGSGALTSSILDTGSGLDETQLGWSATVPEGTTLFLQARSSNDPGNLGEWSERLEAPGMIGDLARYVQYRVGMTTTDPERSPILEEVRFDALGDWVLSEQKISASEGGFTGALGPSDFFGIGLASLGDLDGDGIRDLAVGASKDDDGVFNGGAVWILFMNADDTVKSHQKISMTSGGFTGALSAGDDFGGAVASLGDLDGDSVVDLAVGAWLDDDGGSGRGAVWILFLNADGTVKAHQKISATQGGFVGPLLNGDGFGYSLDPVGDVDGDGVVDLAVGSMWDDDGGVHRGALWILFLNPDGTVKAEQKISQTAGGFTGTLSNEDTIGVSVAGLGDLDGDGIGDLASGADHDDDGGTERGAVWVIFLNADGTVKAHQKISATEGGFAGPLPDHSYFGIGVAAPGDLNHDGTSDLAVGVGGTTGGGSDRGAVWLLFLNPDGTVRASELVGSGIGGFGGVLHDDDWFGYALTGLGDQDGDGFADLAVGSPFDDTDGNDQGSFWLLHLKGGGAKSFCSTSPNSAGPGAHIGSTGSVSISSNDLALAVAGGVPGGFGLFLYGAEPAEVPFGDGLRCIGSGGLGLFRLSPAVTIDATGAVSHALDLTAPPASSGPGAILPGSTWYFQFWYRDPAGAGTGFNLSDGLEVGFCP